MVQALLRPRVSRLRLVGTALLCRVAGALKSELPRPHMASPPPSDAASELASAASLHTPRELSLWQEAVREAGLSPEGVSEFGRSVAKFPESWVRRIMAMDHTKRFRFNFAGSAFTPPRQRQRRAWVEELAETIFDGRDSLRFTDAPEDYQPRGRFDVSRVRGGFRPKGGHRNMFDSEYYALLASSNFTLCPGGDRPWSMRFYEAALAGSIPVIHSVATDYSPPQDELWLKAVNYSYILLEAPIAEAATSLEYSQAVSEHNVRLFIRYQTFIEGDNVPV